MSNATESSKSAAAKVPDTLILILGIVFVAWCLTFFIAPGSFTTETIAYQHGDEVIEKTILKAGSYQALSETQPAPIFAKDDDASLLAFAFNGMTSGDKYGAAIGVMMFILIVGGAFGIIMETQAIDKALLRLLVLIKGRDSLLIPLLCFVFSLGGAVFGMGEEAIVFALIIAPILVSLGYDGITAVLCTYVATQIGFATSWMNPFNVAIAQGLAGVPMLSGAGFRVVMWVVFTCFLMLYCWRYALSIKVDPKRSKSFQSDDYFREHHDLTQLPKAPLNYGERLVLLTLTAGMIWVIWGVVAHGYYIPEIATQFFVMGVIAGAIAVIFKVNQFTMNRAAQAFRKGASDLLPAALVVGFAQGILAVLGGTDPSNPSVLNSILNATSQVFAEFSETASALGMFWFQSIFNFFVTSGSGQAALTMPLMAPIADLVGVSRQVAVLAFQLGDGLTNIIVPTSASLMGTLGVTRVAWANWASFVVKFLLLNFVLAMAFIVTAVAISY